MCASSICEVNAVANLSLLTELLLRWAANTSPLRAARLDRAIHFLLATRRPSLGRKLRAPLRFRRRAWASNNPARACRPASATDASREPCDAADPDYRRGGWFFLQ